MKRPAKRTFLSPPYVGKAERDSVSRAFDSGYVAPCGPAVDEFERRVAEISGCRHAVAVSSATAAIDLLMEEYKVGPGWTVIAPTLTFIATVGPAVHRGAAIAFVDSAADGNIDISLLAEALEKIRGRKFVIGVDLYGRCCDYGAIEKLCAGCGAAFAVDSAESVGAVWRGRRPAGRAGAAGVYSFNGNKIITASGGGAIVTDDPGLAMRARSRSCQSREPVPWYEHAEVGFNYRIGNIAAAIGTAQISRLRAVLRKRAAIAAGYRDALRGSGAAFLPPVAGENHWLNVIFARGTRERDAVLAALESENIEARPVWKPMHLQPVFRGCRCFGGETAERLFATGLCLPSGTGMTAAQVRRTAGIVRKALAE